MLMAALLLAFAGYVLIYSGLKGKPVYDILRESVA